MRGFERIVTSIAYDSGDIKAASVEAIVGSVWGYMVNAHGHYIAVHVPSGACVSASTSGPDIRSLVRELHRVAPDAWKDQLIGAKIAPSTDPVFVAVRGVIQEWQIPTGYK